MALDFMNVLPSAIDATVMFTQIVQVVVTLVIIAVIVLAAKRFKLFYKYPVDIEILKMMSDGKLRAYDSDKARRVREKDGEEYYDVKKRNFHWYPPTFQSQLLKSGGKKVKIYVRELSHNNWEIIDPSTLVKATSKDFQKMQDESTIRFWHNVESEKADIKWKKTDNWKKLMDLLPTAVMLMGIGIFIYLFGNYVIIPVLNQAGAVNAQTTSVLKTASALLERSTQYVELIMRQNGVPLDNAPWLNATNESVIV